jgi:hypothetical protein
VHKGPKSTTNAFEDQSILLALRYMSRLDRDDKTPKSASLAFSIKCVRRQCSIALK